MQIFCKDSAFLRCFLLFVSLTYSLCLYLWGIGLADTFFWINQTHNWSELPLEVLSLFSMNIWGKCFGYTVLNYRILAWLLSSLTILCVYFGMLSKYDRIKYWYYLCGAFVLVGSGIVRCCNPDYFTSFSMGCLLVGVNKYVLQKRLALLFAISLLVSIVVAIRFPNILCIPLIFVLLLMVGKKTEKYRNAFVFLFLSMIFTWVILYFLYDFKDPFMVISMSFANTTSNAHDSHTMIGLLLRYAKSCLLSFITIVLGGIIYYFRKSIITHFTYKIGIILSVCLGISLYYGFYHFIQGSFGWSVGFVVIDALVLLFVAYKKHEEKKEKTILLLFVAMYCFLPSAGSDTGFFKSIIIASAITPFVVCNAKKLIDEKLSRYFFIVGCGVSFIIFNEGITKQTSLSSVPVLRGILMESWQSKAYEKELSNIEPYYKKDKTIFYGYSSAHFLYLATESKPLYQYDFWMEQNESAAINKAIDAMKNNPENVLIDYMKSDEHFFTNRGLKCIAQENNFNVFKY